MNELVVIKNSWGDVWDYFSSKTQLDALGNKGWVHLGKMPAKTQLAKEKEIPEMQSKFKKGATWYRPKSLKGLENNNGWITKTFIGEEEGMYLIIYKETGKKDFIKYTGRYIIKDGMIFDIQDIMPNISHWRKLEFKEPLF